MSVHRSELVVVLLHGVGLAPHTFHWLADLLPEHSMAIPLRTPYRACPHPDEGRTDDLRDPSTVESEAVALLDELTTNGRQVFVVGVSGGATLALAMATLQHPQLVGVLAHEPLIGPLAPELHETVSDACARLLAGSDPVEDRTVEFVRGLVGEPAWSSLPPDAQRFPAVHAAAVMAEVPKFLAYAPSARQLAKAAETKTMTISTGQLSHGRRHRAATELSRLGAAARVIPDAGHLAQWECPHAFADCVRSALARRPRSERIAR